MDPQSLKPYFLSLLSISFLYFAFKAYSRFKAISKHLKNQDRMYDYLAEILSNSPTNTFWFAGNVVTANPSNVEYILKTNFDNYPKGPRNRSTLEDLLGDGIFNADGHTWKLQRKTASFEFNTRSLRNYTVSNVQLETNMRLIPLLERSAATGAVLDFQDILERYAFDNICKVSFDEDPAYLANDVALHTKCSSSFADAFRDAAELSAKRLQGISIPGFGWKTKKLLGIGSERRLKKAVEIVHGFATRVIRDRIKERKLGSEAQAENLLSRFVDKDEYSEEFLRDIVISFILAGRETTSSALTWFFWLISSRKDVESKILEEIAAVRAGSSGDDNIKNKSTFEFEQLWEMQYLHAAITEAMRLYPPVPSTATECQADDVLPDGTVVKKGWSVVYQSYAMGRMVNIWGKDAYEYKPERWLDDEGKFRPESQFKFPVFHGGPRICLGKEMAYIQMKSIVACILERFVVDVVDKNRQPKQTFSLTLRMKGGLPVRVVERC